VCSQRQHLLDNARNSRGRATDRSPIQMRDLVRYTGPEWRTHAHNRRNAPRACSQHAETHHGIPFHSKVCAHRNMRHLKTLGGATNPSSIKMHHIERHTGHEWCIYPHTHRITPHAYFGPAQTPPWTPLHSERAHNIRHLRERAHLLDERATSRSSKCIISSAAPVLSSVLMHTPVETLRTRALAMPKACREPFAVIYGARNGTSHHSARTRV